MGFFSGSFGTGLITGLASGTEGTIKTLMDRRYEELSDARKYILTRNAQKADAAEERKRLSDKEDEEAFDALHQELGGDTDLTYAAFKRLGTAEKVKAYLANVETARAKLQPGQKYDAKLDFTGYTPGDQKRTREEALSQIFTPLETTGRVSAADFAGITPPIFGDADLLADKEAAKLNAKIGAAEPAPVTKLEGFGTVKGLDFTRQVASKEAKREDILFNQKVSAFKQNETVVAEKLRLAKQAEERLQLDQDNRFAQQEYQNAVDAADRVRRYAQYDREAEMHILEKRAAEQGITLKDLQIKTEREGPQFKDFEEMAVYYSNRLADPGLTTQQKNDFQELRDQAVKNAAAFNAQTGGSSSFFGKPNRDALINAEIKRMLEPVGMIDELGQQIETEIEGNLPVYFDNMTRALDNLTRTTKPLNDNTINSTLQGQKEALQAKKNEYKANFGPPIEAANYTEFKSDQFKSTLKVGDVVSYTTDIGDIAIRIWTGNRYIK